MNAVLQYLRQLLTGVESPYLNPVLATVMPPVLTDVAAQPYVWIWSGTAPERRQTAPRAMGYPGKIRPGGYQKFTWKIELSLDLVMSQTDPNIEQAFPTCHDAIVKVLNTVIIPVVVQDPATQQYTQLLTIGENLTSNFAMIRLTGAPGQSLARFGAHIVCDVEEKVSWTEGLPA